MAEREYVLRSKDVARILDCSPDDVIELVRKKKRSATGAGRIWRYGHEDVDACRRGLKETKQCSVS
jgi:hypothetical protein